MDRGSTHHSRKHISDKNVEEKRHIMKKIINIIAFTLVMAATSWGQQWDLLAPQKQKDVAVQITEQVKRVNTMNCRFIQTKHTQYLTEDARSEGRMQYAKPHTLRWEYTSPYEYAIEMNKDTVCIKKNGKEQRQTGGQKRMVNRMMKMIMGISTGNNLFDEKTFKVTLYESTTQYRAIMLPKNGGLKRMFSQIEMIFDKKTGQINKIVLTEDRQTETTISFTNIVTK